MPKKKTSKRWIIFLVAGSVLAMLFIIALPLFALIPSDLSTGNVAMIEVRGVITQDGSAGFGQAAARSSDIVAFIKEAEKDPQVKAIVIDINSPGGSAVASDEIASAVKKASKPTVSLIHEIGTSGAYWIASAADTVIANRMSLTGSIGVIASYLEFSQLMEDYGVSYQRLVSGKYKDVGTPFRQPSSDEQQLLQSKISRIHDYFVEEIALNRNLPEEQVKAIATGEFYLGSEALDLGLVDLLGSSEELEAHLKKELGLDKVHFKRYQRKVSFFEFFAGVLNEQSFFLGKGLGTELAGGSSPLIIQT